jgi:NADH-quinone oxidoreductase subunit B
MPFSVYTSKLAQAVNWARKFSLFEYPFVTACCGMEFMALWAPKYDIARFGEQYCTLVQREGLAFHSREHKTLSLN